MSDTKESPEDAIDSFLGADPVCDVCLKPIVAGDKVVQTFSGTVAVAPSLDGLTSFPLELGIAKYQYTLVHQICPENGPKRGKDIIKDITEL